MKHNERGGRVRSERSTVSMLVLTGRVEAEECVFERELCPYLHKPNM